MVDISTVGIVPVPKRSALDTSCRELPEHVSFGSCCGPLLVVVELGRLPHGRVIYTVVCGTLYQGTTYCNLMWERSYE